MAAVATLSVPDPSDIPEECGKGREGNSKRDDDFDAFAAKAEETLRLLEKATLEGGATGELLVAATEDVVEPTTEPSPTPGRYVTPKDFELLKVIGMGAFGKVLQVRNKQSKKVLAMKVISKRVLRKRAGYIENVVAERDILTRVRHPFVVNMHCSFQTREKLFIIMDFLAGGELFLRLGREGIFLEKTAAFYLGEIILALDHLHTRGILHRDLKPENILLCSDGHICVTDFGLARDLSSETGFGGFQNEEDESRALTVCGTQEYMSPEMLSRKGYGRSSDYWSLGCIAFEMISGRPPFESRKGAKDLFRKIMTEKVKMPDGSTAAVCRLLKGLLNRDVTKRWGAARSTMFEVGGVAGLKGADFFKHLDWEKLEKKDVVPPESLPVDNDEDLRHFYDEFKQMPLPRSVHEMSMETFNPRRVNSDVFRGFSFVHDDFALPDRRNSELHHYWNNLDGDAESESEEASSKYGDEKEQALEAPKELAKKKRPPRKKKKKVAADLSPIQFAGNTRALPEAGYVTPAPSNVADNEHLESQALSTMDVLKSQKTPKPTIPALAAPIFVSTMGVLKSQKTPKPVTPAPAAHIFALPPTPPPEPSEEVWAAVSSSTKKKQQQKGLAQKSARAQLKSPQQQNAVRQQPTKKSQAVPQRQPYRPAQARQPQKLQTSATSHKQQPPPQHVQRAARPNLSVRAQSWKPTSPSNSRPQSASQQKQEVPLPPPSPSGDWRSHSLVRNSPATPARGIRDISSATEAAETQPFWPTLDTTKFTSAAATTAKVALSAAKGAWGSRSKN